MVDSRHGAVKQHAAAVNADPEDAHPHYRQPLPQRAWRLLELAALRLHATLGTRGLWAALAGFALFCVGVFAVLSTPQGMSFKASGAGELSQRRAQSSSGQAGLRGRNADADQRSRSCSSCC